MLTSKFLILTSDILVPRIFYRKNYRKRRARGRGDPEQGSLTPSAAEQATQEDRDDEIIFERKAKERKNRKKKGTPKTTPKSSSESLKGNVLLLFTCLKPLVVISRSCNQVINKSKRK